MTNPLETSFEWADRDNKSSKGALSKMLIIDKKTNHTFEVKIKKESIHSKLHFKWVEWVIAPLKVNAFESIGSTAMVKIPSKGIICFGVFKCLPKESS